MLVAKEDHLPVWKVITEDENVAWLSLAGQASMRQWPSVVLTHASAALASVASATGSIATRSIAAILGTVRSDTSSASDTTGATS